MDDGLGQKGKWTPPGPGEIAAAAAKLGTIPLPPICHKCDREIITGVFIITIWGGIICPVCCWVVEEELEKNGIAGRQRLRQKEREAERKLYEIS